jgi:hypothetical protein
MQHENLVAKVYVAGPEGEIIEQDAARIAQNAGQRMITAVTGVTPPTAGLTNPGTP